MIVSVALIGRFAARKLHQPSVLGELLMGVFIGNYFAYEGYELILVLREGTAGMDIVSLSLAGYSWEEAACKVLGEDTGLALLDILRGPEGGVYLRVLQATDVFSEYGVVFLLFHVGLDTCIAELRQVGADSLRVAILGVLAPFGLGMLTALVLLPQASSAEHMFLAATLGATSIGITARVLRDLNRIRSREAKIVLGAAVMDDVLGLILLAIVSGIVVTGSVAIGAVAHTILLAMLFIMGSLFLGPYLVKFLVWLFCRMEILETKLFISFIFVMTLAWVADLAGLAPIVGAFAAGLLIMDEYFKPCTRYHQDGFLIKDLFAPLEAILAPIFFVLMGMQVKLETFLDWHVILLAVSLIIVGVIGKLVTGLVAGQGVNRLSVGIAMMPRGEVGLVFASVGKGLGVISAPTFSAVVLMVIVTTLAAPPLLKWTLGEGPPAKGGEQ
ncbi:MAG: cation:proton antiporter [Pseudomonadota bacterium]